MGTFECLIHSIGDGLLVFSDKVKAGGVVPPAGPLIRLLSVITDWQNQTLSSAAGSHSVVEFNGRIKVSCKDDCIRSIIRVLFRRNR